MTQALLYPVLALVMLTFVVWALMGFYRIRFLLVQRIHPQQVATRHQAGHVFAPVAKVADHFQNLFEVPVLFYALVALLLLTDLCDTGYVTMAWAFVVGRMAHAWIHCTYNKVRHRFLAFVVSSLVLWGMWGRFAMQIVMQA